MIRLLTDRGNEKRVKKRIKKKHRKRVIRHECNSRCAGAENFEFCRTKKNLLQVRRSLSVFEFTLDEDWDNLLKFAQFRQGGVAYNQYLDNENGAYLPAEIGEGTCTMMLYGSGGEVIGTTNYVTFTIDKNNLISDSSSTEISESLYQQLVTKINALSSWNGRRACLIL